MFLQMFAQFHPSGEMGERHWIVRLLATSKQGLWGNNERFTLRRSGPLGLATIRDTLAFCWIVALGDIARHHQTDLCHEFEIIHEKGHTYSSQESQILHVPVRLIDLN